MYFMFFIFLVLSSSCIIYSILYIRNSANRKYLKAQLSIYKNKLIAMFASTEQNKLFTTFINIQHQVENYLWLTQTETIELINILRSIYSDFSHLKIYNLLYMNYSPPVRSVKLSKSASLFVIYGINSNSANTPSIIKTIKNKLENICRQRTFILVESFERIFETFHIFFRNF